MQRIILVVEDSPTELKLMQSALEGRGYRIVTATDGEDALARAAEHLPDLIVLDILLPKKNGYQVCRQLKLTPETSGIKIVMVSSKSQNSDKFWGLKQGADEYLAKPFLPQDLVASVERHL